MKTIATLLLVPMLFGCGVEILGTTATTAKLQAEQARQAKETLNGVKESVEASNKALEQSNKQIEQAVQAAKN